MISLSSTVGGIKCSVSCQLIGLRGKGQVHCFHGLYYGRPYMSISRRVSSGGETGMSARAGQLSHQRGMCVTPYRKFSPPSPPQQPPATPSSPLNSSQIKPAVSGPLLFVVFVRPVVQGCCCHLFRGSELRCFHKISEHLHLRLF